MKDTLHYLVSTLVQHPEEVVIEEQTSEDGLIQFTIQVSPVDMGKVIGKEGRIIRALRNVMKIPAMKHNLRINITLFDPAQES